MRALAYVLLAGAFMAPLPSTAQPAASSADEPAGYWCSGVSGGMRGESVAVTVAVDPQGNKGSVITTWHPPQTGDAGRGQLDRPDVAFEITFHDSTEAAIGRPGKALLSVAVFAPLRDRVPPERLVGRLASLSGSYRFGDDPPRALGSFAQAADSSLPGTAIASERIDYPFPLPASLNVELRNKQGGLASSSRFILNETASRDSLLRTAWADAQAAASQFKSCQPQTD